MAEKTSAANASSTRIARGHYRRRLMVQSIVNSF